MFDFSEVFTVAARRAVPLVLGKKLAFSFDCSAAIVSIDGTPDALQGACHRIFLAAVAMLQTGFVTFIATAQPTGGSVKLCVHAGGIGEVHDGVVMEAVRTNLGLSLATEDTEVRASGFWPALGGRVRLHVVPGDGVLITLEVETAGTYDAELPVSAHGARVWLVNVDDVMGAAWVRRFQRLGWAVSRFASYEAAAAQLASQPESARPSVVVVVETGDPATDGASRLPDLLPAWTRLIYAVPAGSASLRHPRSVPGYEVHVFPFSPDQLRHFTTELENHDAPSGHTMPMSLEAGHMPTILLVDDSAVNLIVGRAMLEALGYAVRTAANGKDAIECCQTRVSPAAVLMDVNMPEMNGLAATKRLRALQRSGAMPPFPIIGFTSAWTDDLRLTCLRAGMEECLSKPLALMALGPQLRRVITMV